MHWKIVTNLDMKSLVKDLPTYMEWKFKELVSYLLIKVRAPAIAILLGNELLDDACSISLE